MVPVSIRVEFVFESESESQAGRLTALVVILHGDKLLLHKLCDSWLIFKGYTMGRIKTRNVTNEGIRHSD